MWVVVITAFYLRIFVVTKWFKNPPSSFELIRKQGNAVRSFWIPLSALLVISLSVALILNWNHELARVHIIGAMVCFGLTGILNVFYFIREVMLFSKMPAHATQTPDLIRRTKSWLKWAIIRDLLLVIAALFISIAYNHA
jgi:hypothetical protein